MSRSIIIDVYRLMALLNELFSDGQKAFEVFMPFLKPALFSVKLHTEEEAERTSEVELMVPYRHYQESIQRINPPFVRREIPQYRALQALLVQAGIREYPNFNRFLLKVHELCQRDFHKGDRPVFMGLDTNLFRDRFYSANYYTLEHIPDNKIGFSVSPNVKDELTFDKSKYKERDLRDLARAAVDRQFSEVILDLFNQSCLADRLRRLGFVELEKIKRIHWIELLPELDPKEVENSPDLNIIKTYKLAAAERNVDILLLSRDDGFIGHAEGIPGILTFQIEYPSIKAGKPVPARWHHICQLLYLAAIVSGVVRVKASESVFLLQGIWKGKRSRDWNKERIQMTTLRDGCPVFARCQKVWRVLDGAKWEAV